jgi:hypothetical protein
MMESVGLKRNRRGLPGKSYSGRWRLSNADQQLKQRRQIGRPKKSGSCLSASNRLRLRWGGSVPRSLNALGTFTHFFTLICGSTKRLHI